jgi:yecA family protein
LSTVAHGRVQALLTRLRSDLDAAECHGVLCGMLCGPRAFDARLWLDYLRGEDEAAGWSGAEASALFEALAADTRRALDGDDYDFALLLPADDEGLAGRASAFAGWCRGFLSGIGLGGVGELATLGEDGRGFIADLDRFCRIAFADAAGEDDERAFAELVEFTRMGVLVLYAERDALPPDAAAVRAVLH